MEKNILEDKIKIIQIYFLLKIIFLSVGVILFWFNIVFPSYLVFLFEDSSLYTFSIITPVILIIGYLYCIMYLPLYSNIARTVAVLLAFSNLFYFPFGTIISVGVISELLYYNKDFPSFDKKTVPYRLIGSLCIISSIVGIFFSIGVIADFQRDIGYDGLAMFSLSDFDSDSYGDVDVVIQLKGLGSSGVSTQEFFIQKIENVGGVVSGSTYTVLNTVNALVSLDELQQLASDPDVIRIVPNEKIYTIDGFNDDDYVYMLDNSYSMVNVEPLWNLGVTGKDVVVAVVDTGINEDMEWLQRDGESVVVDSFELYGDWVHSHGTLCASCIASQHPDYRGIAPDVSLLDVEVFQDDGGAYLYDILEGWDWVANWKNTYGQFVVCSNSFGGPSYGSSSWDHPDILSEAANNMANRYRIPMVCAAGNEGPDPYTLAIPGQAEHVLSVGAVDDEYIVAVFSSRGPTDDGHDKPDVVAPGVSVNMFDANGNQVSYSGTSFSTPMVAAIFALMAQDHQAHHPSQFYSSLRKTANDLGYGGFDYDYGYGFVDAEQAYLMIDGQMPLGNYDYVFTGIALVGIGIIAIPEWRKRR